MEKKIYSKTKWLGLGVILFMGSLIGKFSSIPPIITLITGTLLIVILSISIGIKKEKHLYKFVLGSWLVALIALGLSFINFPSILNESKTNEELLKPYTTKTTPAESPPEIEFSKNLKDEIVNEYLTKELKPVRKNFKRVNSIQEWDSIVSIDLYESTEGGYANFYYQNRRLEKVLERNFGETAQWLTEYYLHNNKLSFVLEKKSEYNRPFYWDSTHLKEFGDTAVFDFSKSQLEESRSYFLNKKLVHQILSEDCGSPFSEEYLITEQKRITNRFFILKNMQEEIVE